MLCKDPVSVGSHLFPCGRCEPCRINRKRLWTNRLLLEAGEHGSNAFLTLTYRDERLPRTASGTPTLEPTDVRNWLKRIRKAVEPARLRFYLVGEYGDRTWRPHYHVALFGFEPCANGRTIQFRGRPMADRCCSYCRLVHSSWGFGDVDVGRMEEGSAKYLCGYVLKKMTRNDDPRLDGRWPEFARMSLRPGIGQRAMHDIADVILRLGLDESEADVPSALRRGKTIAPLGRYLRQQLRLMIGKEVGAPDEVLREAAERLRPLREIAKLDEEHPSFKWQVVQAFAQDVLNREKRQTIYSKRGQI